MKLSITSDLSAAANRALMTGSPEYFSWSEDAQERFRAAPGREARCRMEQVLLKQVLGIECSAAQASEVWNELSLEQLNQINPADLLTKGIGEDFVYLNESLAEGQSLLDFDTLYDYDHDDFLFQEQWRHKDLKNYVSPGYFPLYQPRWVRLLIDDELVYGNLYSLAGYVMSRVAELDLQRELAELPSGAHILHDQSPVPGEIMVNLVIRNEATMRQIHWKALLADIRACQGSREEVDRIIERETERALAFITDQHRDVIDHYVPPDIAPGKERKLIMSSGALRDLQRLREEDEDDE